MQYPKAKLLRTAVTFVLSFGLGNGVAFFAAIALPRLVDPQTYGGIELALTVGLLTATVLGLGAPSVSVRFDLVDKDPRSELILVGYCLWLATLGAIAAPLAIAVNQPAEYVLGLALLGLFGFQASASAYARMRGHIHVSGWLDNITIMAIFVVAGALSAFGTASLPTLTWCMVGMSVGLACMAACWILGKPVTGMQTLVVQVASIGVPMMVFGFAQMLLFGTSRIAIGKALGLDDVASFSLCARVALLLVFINQILNIGLFRSVYRMDVAMIGRVFSLWIAALAALGVLVAFAGCLFAEILVAGTGVKGSAFAHIFPLVVIQTVVWILSSNMEMFVVRELLSRQAAVTCLLIVGIGFVVGLALFAASVLTLSAVISLYCVAMVVMLLTQMLLLSRKGVNFRSAYVVLPLVASPGLAYLLPSVG